MPQRPLPDPSHSLFQCDYPGCVAKYRRKEHLNRHLAHHCRSASLSCPYCTSTLTRSDLLRRHIRIYHRDREPPATRAQKACTACRSRKERCHGGFPCSACEKRGISCSFEREPSQAEHPVDNIEISPGLPLLTPGPAPAGPSSSRWIAHDYVDIYFAEFHQKWPFLHQGTFDLTKEPCVLIQSVVMIGLWIEGSKKSRDAAKVLHRSLMTAIRTQMDQWRITERDQSTSWPMPTYQSVLLQCIFALFLAGERADFDLNLRFRIQDDEYDLLVALVETCRLGGLFSCPSILTQHSSATPLTLVWLSMEEIKRFGLALYKVCRMSACPKATGAHVSSAGSELLTLEDLSFSMPDSDQAWNSPLSVDSEALQRARLSDNRDRTGSISQTSNVLYDTHVSFDWL
ncbi:hypothetical protein BJX61DRAFT_502094 [Aspergillus egyptiacus]|nr:hypothetical protein BJX61DRAFT_502094 [Aspergillus egyptiacus]